MQLPLHVTLARFSIGLTPQNELEVQDTLAMNVPALSIPLGKCEIIKAANIVWINVADIRPIDVLARLGTETVQRVAPLENSNILYSRTPHVTLAYRDYSEGDMAEIFKKATSMCNSFLPLDADIDQLFLCRRNSSGSWEIARPYK